MFYYVGRLGSITAAAEALCISQPAVSQAVKQLEKALNSQLFIRTQKGVRLTAEGELLFPYVERGIENLLDGERRLRRLVDLDIDVYKRQAMAVADKRAMGESEWRLSST